MAYKIIQTVEHGSRFLNLDQIVSVSTGTVGEGFYIEFVTTSPQATYMVKFDSQQEALDLLTEVTGIKEADSSKKGRSAPASIVR